jgi:hypothetical protein
VGRGSRIALGFVALGLAVGAAAAQPAIRFAEPVNLALKASHAEFDAYGRRFSLALEGNDRVLQKLSGAQKSALGSYRMLRGSLAGVPGSWARLTETPAGIEGAIWDGAELYAVTRYENIAPFLTTPLAASPGQTVVYRLSDARDAMPADFCDAAGTQVAAGTALDQYKEIVGELQMQTGGVVGPSITRQIEISLIADSAFQQAEGGDPTAAMVARLNIVEGIFSEQVGLLILAGEIRLVSPDADPFTTTKPTTLLEQLGKYRSNTPAVRARGLAHLMTGKDLDGTTAGIAYVGTVCEKERAVSLSQRSYGTTISALIMAHELGHNFGASHDGEPGTPCASTAAGFIMASSVTGYGTLSQCSIDTMKPVIASASCITAAEFADVALEADGPNASGEGGVPLTLPFTLRSTGNVDAEDTELSVTLPPSATISITAATASQGSCTIDGNNAHCRLGILKAGGAAQVTVTALSTTGANFTVQARAAAANDRLTSNDSRLVQVYIRSGIDARLAMSASAAEIGAGSPFEVYADVASLRAMAVRDASVSLNLNQPVATAGVPGGTCSVNGGSVLCTITEIPSGETRRVTVRATAGTAGPLFASGSISAAGEGDLTNNQGAASAWVQAARDVEVNASSAALDLPVGSVHEIPYVIHSRGVEATGAVELLFTTPAALSVDAIDAGGAACVHPSDYVWRCALGALAPGESRPVTLRFHATAPTTGDISAVAVTSDDGYLANNSSAVPLRIDHLYDLGVSLASGGSGIEDTLIEGQVALASNGRQGVVGGTLDVILDPAGTLISVTLPHGRACALISEDRARCTLPTLARGATLFIDYTAEFAEPGTYEVTFQVAAPGDSAPANDALTRPVLVRPWYDVSVAGSLDMPGLFGEQRRVQSFTVRTDRRALATARLLASHAAPALRVEAISAGVGDCRVDDELGGVCDFTDLPADSSVAVSISYLALDGSSIVEPAVSVSTPGDVRSSNDRVVGHVETLGSTDLELRVDGSLGGPRATSLNFPTIEVVNGNNRAMTPRLEVVLPPGVNVADVSASEGICSGSSTLRCDFDTLAPFARASVTLSVRASTDGNFVSNVKVSALNDVNPANDAREVAVEIGGTNVQASNGPGTGKGGGGRMEWLALALLGLLVARKQRAPIRRRA